MSIKEGNKVRITTTGQTGKVVNIRNTSKGDWADVNIGDAKKPKIKSVRPSQCEKV